MELPTLPYQVIVPAVSAAALAAVVPLADREVHPVRAAQHAAVTVALVLACAAAPATTAVTR
jgi:hypothetical protein